MATPRSTTTSPTDIARETFRRLALEKIPPTPDAYRKLYLEISGQPDDSATGMLPVTADDQAVKQEEEWLRMLLNLANVIKDSAGPLTPFGHRLQRAAQGKDWAEYQKTLDQLAQYVTTEKKPSAGIALVDPEPAPALKSAGIPLVDPEPALQPKSAGIALVDAQPAEDTRIALLKDFLYRTLNLALPALLKHSPPLAQEAEALGTAVRESVHAAALEQLASRLKQLCFQIELSAGDGAEVQELLLRLFDLLLTNIHDLLDNDNWLRGQIEVVQQLIAGPIDHRALQEATRSLKDVIYKQGILKNSIAESKTSVQNMMAAFLDRLNAMAQSTEQYQSQMSRYSSAIGQAASLDEVRGLISHILDDTRTVQSETQRSRDIILAAQKEVREAEARIKELEDKLAHMSELVREDQLTGSLNRRGMEDVFEREMDRADRRQTPLCVALLDLDNFKKLNDTHGHAAGDEALIHLVRIVKQTLRSVDVIARYGGEEFLIIMPETALEEAASAMTRVQRELTRHFFTAGNQRLFITFSAGVALRQPRETQDALIKRADQAMYEAKRSGKNRVVTAN